MRHLLVMLVLVAGCGDGGETRPATGPAGEVVALSGDVRAERGDPPESRALAVGDVVHAEDVIVTADGASVQILLAHNRATWSLEGGERRAVRASAAWKAPKQQGGGVLAAGADDRTTAAGRHAEREAAETRATAADMELERTEAEPPAAPTGGAPTPEPAAAAAPAAEPEPAPARSAAPPPPPPPAPPRKKRSSGSRKSDRSAKGGSGTLELDPFNDSRSGSSSDGSGGAVAERAVRGRVAVAALAVDGALAADAVRGQIDRRLGTLRRCYEVGLRDDPTLSGVLAVELEIGADGTVSAGRLTSGKDALASASGDCVVRALRSARFPASEDGTTTVRVRISFEVTK